MRLGVIRIEPQHRFVMVARFGMPVGAKQKIGQVHPRHRVSGVVQDRLGIDAAGGIDRAHMRQQRPEFVQRAEILGRPAQDIDEGELRLLSPIEGAKQYGALDFGCDGIARGRRHRQQIIELPQPQFLRQPRRPAAAVAGSLSGSKAAAFWFSPVTISAKSGAPAEFRLLWVFNHPTIG